MKSQTLMAKGKYKNLPSLCSCTAAWDSVNRLVTVSQNGLNLVKLDLPFSFCKSRIMWDFSYCWINPADCYLDVFAFLWLMMFLLILNAFPWNLSSFDKNERLEAAPWCGTLDKRLCSHQHRVMALSKQNLLCWYYPHMPNLIRL